MRPLASLALLVPALLGACADGAEDEATTTLADPFAEALALLDAPWCEPFAERLCAAATTCGCGLATGWPTEGEACLAAARAQCHRDLRVRAEGLSEAGFLVSRDGVPRCLELLDEALARCDQPERSRFTTECRLVVPSVGESFPRAGEPCPSGLCGRGLRCATDQICRVPHPAGDRCFSDGDCLSPLVCRSDCTKDPTCASVCTERPASPTGETCQPEMGLSCGESASCHMSSRRACTSQAGGTCTSDLECPSGQVCGLKGTMTCTPLPGLGEFCGDRFQCREGFACDPASFNCAEAPGRGERCMGLEFGLASCRPGLACRDGLCGAPGELGEACRFGADDCADGLGCEFDAVGIPVCQPFRELDERCQSDIICGPDAFCDFTTLTCRAKVGEGVRCSDGSRCLGDMQCVESEPGELRCQEVAAEGDACAFACPAGLSCQPVARASRCVSLMCTMLRL
ncbi:MAG: hypothetical protein IT385_12290 [Deltaproteobacteria bacterium]|nr:hypothetical protein [Deltaproteobacteria bacterium]